MSEIWKYELLGTQAVQMPVGAVVLTAQMQRGAVTIWARVNPDAHRKARTFRVVGTGHPFEDTSDWHYIATVQDGQLVWHVFEVAKWTA